VTSPAASANEAKYESGNPVLRALIGRFQGRVVDLLGGRSFRTVLDAGCGEGYLSRVLLDRFPGIELAGFDLSETAIAAAARRCPEGRFRAGRLDELAGFEGRFDLVVCSEVLEHLADPEPALRLLAGRAAGHVLLSVPWEPWFRLANLARGKYLATLGNHPEHVQAWSAGAFVKRVEPYFETVHVETCFPWTIYLGRPRAGR
jgi:2-polyprenyl-3-methyl-5-hydroxy-6-metoxy-1,4-benzoquinol methylase